MSACRLFSAVAVPLINWFTVTMGEKGSYREHDIIAFLDHRLFRTAIADGGGARPHWPSHMEDAPFIKRCSSPLRMEI